VENAKHIIRGVALCAWELLVDKCFARGRNFVQEEQEGQEEF